MRDKLKESVWDLLAKNPDMFGKPVDQEYVQDLRGAGFPAAAHIEQTGTLAPWSADVHDAEINRWIGGQNFGGGKLPERKK